MDIHRRRLRDHDDASQSRQDASGISENLESAALLETDAAGLVFWVRVLSTILVVTLIILPIRNSCHFSEDCLESNMTDCFSENQARTHLQKVTGLGPRTAGSIANEVAAPKYLLRELYGIAALANRSGLSAEVDEQISGYSGLRTHFHVTTYRNLRNLILRIHDPRKSVSLNQSNRSAFLINCHYDSAISSPGASDAFVSCAIMMEVARVLASGANFLVNDLIFLFNGAEESILPASHAFITQHRWAPYVNAFLNLEGAGAGGRMVMFQTGPGDSSKFLLNIYSQSFNNPSGNVLGEDLFQSGLIPSDTDYRIFRDYGGLPGLDMAYVCDGYAYHTPYDTEARILPACLQQTGNDILRFVRLISLDERLQHVQRLSMSSLLQKWQMVNASLLTSHDIDRSLLHYTFTQSSPHERYVYFDVFGYYFVVVPWVLWKYFNLAIVTGLFIWLIVNYYSAAMNSVTRRYLGRVRYGLVFAFVLQMVAQATGFVFAYCLGSITHSYGSRMSWFSSRYNLIGIFILPFIWWFFWFFSYLCRVPDGVVFRLLSIPVQFFIRINWLHRSNKINYHSVSRDFLDATLLIISLNVLILSLLDIPSVFVAAVWLSLVLAARMALKLFAPTSSISTSSMAMLIIILPAYCLTHLHFCASLLEFALPVMGRSGTIVRPDVILSVLLFYMLTPVTLLLSGCIQCTSINASQMIRLMLLNTCITYAILVHTSPYGFPYSIASNHSSVSPRHQRIIAVHCHRTLRWQTDSSVPTQNESFIFLLPLDANGIRYLKPNSYPSFIPTSFLSLFTSSPAGMERSPHGGLKELLDNNVLTFNSTLPYCGVSYVYPLIHIFSEAYFIPAEANKIDPPIKLTLRSREAFHKSSLGSTWNFTFSVDSGPPHINLMIRTDPPHVSLSNWSFHSIAPPIPMPIPNTNSRKGESDARAGAHHVVYHINAGAYAESPGAYNSPWVFWLLVNLRSDASPENGYFDLAVGGTYLDESAPSSRSAQLDDFVARLPRWTTVWRGGSTYEHWRFSLTV